MTPRLIRLPDGTWVSPDDVRSVKALDDAEHYGGGFIPPRVVVFHGNDSCTRIECPDFDAALAMRDRIGREVNDPAGAAWYRGLGD